MTDSTEQLEGLKVCGFVVDPLSKDEKKEFDQAVGVDTTYVPEYEGIRGFIQREQDKLSRGPGGERLEPHQILTPEVIEQIFLASKGAVAGALITASVRKSLEDLQKIIKPFHDALTWLFKKKKAVHELPEILLRDKAYGGMLHFVKGQYDDVSCTGIKVIRRRIEGDKEPGIYQYHFESPDGDKNWRLTINGLGDVIELETFP